MVYLRARRRAKRALNGRKLVSRKNRKVVEAQPQTKAAQLEMNYNEDSNGMGYC